MQKWLQFIYSLQILESHGRKGTLIFNHTHPKIINFKLFWICICMQKIGLYHKFILDIQPILESKDQNSHTHH